MEDDSKVKTTERRKLLFLGFIIGVLLTIVIMGGLGWFYTSNMENDYISVMATKESDYLDLQANLAKVQNELDQTRSELQDMEDKLNTSIIENSQSNATIEELTIRLTDIETELGDSEDKYQRMRDQTLTLDSKLGESNREIASLEELLDCDNSSILNVDYTGNSAISSALKNFLADIRGDSEDATWDVIWTGSRAAIHNISTSDVKDVFVVYFEDRYFSNDRIYWVNNECWLDR